MSLRFLARPLTFPLDPTAVSLSPNFSRTPWAPSAGPRPKLSNPDATETLRHCPSKMALLLPREGEGDSWPWFCLSADAWSAVACQTTSKTQKTHHQVTNILHTSNFTSRYSKLVPLGQRITWISHLRWFHQLPAWTFIPVALSPVGHFGAIDLHPVPVRARACTTSGCRRSVPPHGTWHNGRPYDLRAPPDILYVMRSSANCGDALPRQR